MKEDKRVWPMASLVALTGLNLLDYLDRQILAAVLTPVKEALHLSDEQLGTIATAFMIGYFVTSPLFGSTFTWATQAVHVGEVRSCDDTQATPMPSFSPSLSAP